MIVGASAGALLGAVYAAEGDPGQLEQAAHKATPFSLLQWLLRGLRVATGDGPFARALWHAYGQCSFAEMKIPFAVTAIDIANGEVVTLNEGSVREAVEASIRPPVIMSTIKLGERFLVDGGLHNTVPVAAAQALGAQRIIAINVGEFVRLPRAWLPLAAQAERLLRGRAASPHSRYGQAAFMAGLLRKAPPERPAPDILIRPNMRGIRSTVPMRMGEAVRRGERAAEAALPAIWAMLAEPAAQTDEPREGSATSARPGVVTPSRSFSAHTSHST